MLESILFFYTATDCHGMSKTYNHHALEMMLWPEVLDKRQAFSTRGVAEAERRGVKAVD